MWYVVVSNTQQPKAGTAPGKTEVKTIAAREKALARAFAGRLTHS
ncbi:Uncharacterised protein [Actinobaculum suis]|uniref:Uncharacterized protein n=1 Tax=Actinobaculum suis TaxID=1657 RepID=A0A7Z8YAF1_9ACTO|nr:Uncharacterised protein [Actinobaculum suis]